MKTRHSTRERNLTDLTDRSRHEREIRAQIMKLCPEYAEAYGELIEAEIEYDKVRNCKKTNPPVYYAARDRVQTCRNAAGLLSSDTTTTLF